MKHRPTTAIPSPTDALAGLAPFADAPPAALRQLAPHVDRLRVRPGSVLATEGQHARAFVAVLAGEVRATRGGRVVSIEGPGAQIGAASLTRHEAHDATWVAMSDVEILVVNGPAYRWAHHELLGPSPERTAA